MIEYAAILPHSPLLLFQQGKGLHETMKSFQKVANDLQSLEIEQILFISRHPAFHRAGFSAYIHPEYEIAFEAFGDLATSHTWPICWDLFYLMQENPEVPALELIDSPKIDYGHAIPLQILSLRMKDKIPALAINDWEESTHEERIDFGKNLGKSLQASPKRIAVIVTGDLYITQADQQINEIQQRNTNLRQFLASHSEVFPIQKNDLENTQAPCFFEPFDIFSAALPNNLEYQELSFEQSPQTSFLVARYISAKMS